MKYFFYIILTIQLAFADGMKYDFTFLSFDEENSINYYLDNNGNTVGISNKIIIKTQNYDKLKELEDSLEFSILFSLSEEIYLLEVKNMHSTLSLSHHLNNKSFVEYAHPDLIQNIQRR